MKLEDLKVGQFVRFKDKRGNTYIRNIKEVCNEQPHKSWGAIIIDKNANNVPYVSLKNIIKASYNIIDILEEGDIISFYEDIDNYKKQYVIGIPDLITLDQIKDKITNDNIRLVSILTKEEMEQMAYKVGD